jgi:putative redox protein
VNHQKKHYPPQVAVATWKGDQEFDAGVPGRATIRVDGHSKTAPSPVDLMVISIGTCSAVDVVEILAKRRTPVEALEVTTTVTRADEAPRKLTHVWVTFKIRGAGIERVHAERAIELSVNKYCSVRTSLDPEIPVEWNLELNES